MIKKKFVRKKNIDEEGMNPTSLDENRHQTATKSVQAWYNKHPDTSVYSKKFNHKKQTQHQEDL